MKKLEGNAFLSDDGELFITAPGVRDPFAQPNAPDPEPVLQATGFTYEDVPTYGWPLGVIYKNNPLHFATVETAEFMRRMVVGAVGKAYSVDLAVDRVKVGPFTRADIRTIQISDGGGWLVDLNAGEEADQLARSSGAWRERLWPKIEAAKAKRVAASEE